jgi:antitoxin (DNA-binding transcriptional repressor) of toxin-antitoxin stability system
LDSTLVAPAQTGQGESVRRLRAQAELVKRLHSDYVHIKYTFMYVLVYAKSVRVTITQFRKDLFKLVERAIGGETVEFVHQGATIRLTIPAARSSKLERLTPRQISNPNMTEEEQRAAERKLQAEIQAELEKDWSEI